MQYRIVISKGEITMQGDQVKKPFMSACLEFFGTLPGQTKMGFGKEIQQLSLKDKKEIHTGLQKAIGIEIVEPTDKAA